MPQLGSKINARLVRLSTKQASRDTFKVVRHSSIGGVNSELPSRFRTQASPDPAVSVLAYEAMQERTRMLASSASGPASAGGTWQPLHPALPCLQLELNVGSIDFQFANFCCGREQAHLPKYGHGVINWQQSRQPLTTLQPSELIPVVEGHAVSLVQWDLKVVTVNIQSGIDKQHYLEQQFLWHGVHVAFLQEVKGKEILIRSPSFLRYESQSDGVWGCAVWISRTAPLAKCQGQMLYVQMVPAIESAISFQGCPL